MRHSHSSAIVTLYVMLVYFMGLSLLGIAVPTVGYITTPYLGLMGSIGPNGTRHSHSSTIVTLYVILICFMVLSLLGITSHAVPTIGRRTTPYLGLRGSVGPNGTRHSHSSTIVTLYVMLVYFMGLSLLGSTSHAFPTIGRRTTP